MFISGFVLNFFFFLNLDICCCEAEGTEGRVELVRISLLGVGFVFWEDFLEKSLARSMQELVGRIQDTSQADGQL